MNKPIALRIKSPATYQLLHQISKNNGLSLSQTAEHLIHETLKNTADPASLTLVTYLGEANLNKEENN